MDLMQSLLSVTRHAEQDRERLPRRAALATNDINENRPSTHSSRKKRGTRLLGMTNARTLSGAEASKTINVVLLKTKTTSLNRPRDARGRVEAHISEHKLHYLLIETALVLAQSIR